MSDEKHPYDLNKPSHFDKATNRISGFIGGGVAGLVIGVIGLVLATKLSSVPLDFAFFGIIVSVFLFALIGAIWPKWFAWILDIGAVPDNMIFVLLRDYEEEPFKSV